MTVILLCPLSIQTIKAIAAIATKAIERSIIKFISPCLAPSNACPTALGRPATILENIMIEIPLPIPFSVTSSPSHIKNTVPETKDVTAMIWNIKPGSNANP